MHRPASASHKGRPSTPASSIIPPSTSPHAVAQSLGSTVATSMGHGPPVDSVSSTQPSAHAGHDLHPDLLYAKSVERSLNRAMSARTKAKIQAIDHQLALKLAQQGGSAPLSDSEDEHLTSTTDSSALDVSPSMGQRAVNKHEDDEDEDDDDPSHPTTGRQVPADMLYDLHLGSSKPNYAGPLSKGKPPKSSQSPPLVEGSATSLLPSGSAIHDLSITGTSATSPSSSSGPLSLAAHCHGSPTSGLQRLGLGNEYPMERSLGIVSAASSKPPPPLQRSSPAIHLVGHDRAGTELSDGDGSESLWDTHADRRTLLTGNESPTTEPPLSSSDLDALFAYVTQFKPDTIDLEPVLKPFLPDYMPAIGDLEAMIKIPPPGPPENASTMTATTTTTPTTTTNVAAEAESSSPSSSCATLSFLNDLGITILDEPAAKQSDRAVLHYQLTARCKASAVNYASGANDGWNGTSQDGLLRDPMAGPGLVHAIYCHDAPHKLSDWIASTNSPDWVASRAAGRYGPTTGSKGKFPTVDKLMEAWDTEFVGDGNSDVIQALTAVDPQTGVGVLGALDLPLADVVRIACALMGIPVYASEADGGGGGGGGGSKKPGQSLIDALYCFFEVYMSYSENVHFNNSNQYTTPDTLGVSSPPDGGLDSRWGSGELGKRDDMAVHPRVGQGGGGDATMPVRGYGQHV